MLSEAGVLSAGHPTIYCRCASLSRPLVCCVLPVYVTSIFFELPLESPGARDESKQYAQTRISPCRGCGVFDFWPTHTDRITELLRIRILPFCHSVVAIKRGLMSPTSMGCCACLSLKEPSLGCVDLTSTCWTGRGHPGPL